MEAFKFSSDPIKSVFNIFKNKKHQFSELFKSITENPLVGVYILQDNKFKYVSEGWSIITGYSYEETVDKMETLDIIVPDDINSLQSYVNKRMSGDIKTADSQFRIIRKDGEQAYVKVFGNLINFNGKKAVAGILIDITQQHAIEQELKENARKYKSLVENSLVGVYLIQDNRFRYVNNHFCEIFGYESEEIVDILDPPLLVHDDDKDKVANNIKRRLNGESGSLKYEFKGLKKDNTTIYIQVLGTTMQYKNRAAIMGTLIDTTELKLAEDALKESEHLFQTLLNLAPYPISVTDESLRHLIVNKSYCNTFKIEEANVLGKTPHELNFLDEEKYYSNIKEMVLKSNRVDNWELALFNNDGEKKHFLYSCLKLHYKDSTLIMNTFIDVTESKITQEELARHRNNLEILVKDRTDELNKRNQELNNSNRLLLEQKKNLEITLNNLHTAQQQLIQSEKMASLGLLSAGIAHEINNPLNFIMGGSLAIENYLKENPGNNIEEAQTYLNAINEGVNRTADIVSSLNHYSRKNDMERTSCQMNNILSNCLTMLKSKIDSKTEIIKNLSPTLPDINANEGQLHQVMLNIIYNSIQAIDNHTGKIQIVTKVSDNQIIVEILDNGKGIPKEVINNVFDPFYTTKEPGEGTGLGLSISYNIIKEHNGTIKINSEPGEWTCTEIRLPVNETTNE
nr:PAS domain S-box protein [uncultured Carboxylicivirga sp.]